MLNFDVFFSDRLNLKDINSFLFGPYFPLSVKYGPNQGFKLAVPEPRKHQESVSNLTKKTKKT